MRALTHLVGSLALLLVLLLSIASCQVSTSASKTSSVASFSRPTQIVCTRRCNTKYSDGNCWKKSFSFFIDDLVYSLLNFIKSARLLSQRKDILLYNNLELSFNETFDKFSKPFRENFNNSLDFPASMDLCKHLIVNEYRQLFMEQLTVTTQQVNSQQRNPQVLDCPRSNYYADVTDSRMQANVNEESKVRVLKALTFFFLFTSVLMISMYLFMYLLVESRLVKSYKKL